MNGQSTGLPTGLATGAAEDLSSAALLFFHGDGLAGELVRLGTHSPFAHVAIRVGSDVYEAVAPRILRRAFEPEGRDKGATIVSLPPACKPSLLPAMVAFLDTCVGMPYDWTAIAEDAVEDVLADLDCQPKDIGLYDHRTGSYDCSRLAAAALATLGWHPAAIDHLDGPISPGDLYRLVEAEASLSH